jgi:23S rRNA pseudouridine2605 synthase
MDRLGGAMRINRYIAQSGICSRRRADEYIAQGRIKVNGRLQTDPGYQISSEDVVIFDGKPVKPMAEATVVLMVNKPVGYVSTLNDPHAGKKVIDLVPEQYRRYSIVGRLDKDSRGLILLTNNGDLCNRLTHPRYQIEKEYEVEVSGRLEHKIMEAAVNGVESDSEFLCIDRYLVLCVSSVRSRLRVVLHHGHKREIRRIFSVLGYPVIDLVRLRLDDLELGDLPPGEYRSLSQVEVARLQGFKKNEKK